MKKFTTVTGILVILIACAGHASLELHNLPDAVKPGVVQMVCLVDGGPSRIASLGTLLQIPSENSDVAIVTGHGLKDASACKLLFGDQSLDITSVIRGSGRGAYSDWAVVSLSGRFSGEVQRYWWQAVAPDQFSQLQQEHGHVVMLKHHNGHQGTNCQVHIPKFGLKDETDQNTVLLADCTIIPGMSGAPVLATVDGVAAMVGLNIGYRYDLSGEPIEWKQKAAVVRLIDQEIDIAIARTLYLSAESRRRE